jgi:hypothetical protein
VQERPVPDIDALAPQQCRGGKSLGKDDGHGDGRSCASGAWTAACHRPLLERGYAAQAALAIGCVVAAAKA